MGFLDALPWTYKYYDTPDGQDIGKKLLVTTKYGLITSIPVACTDILLYSHPRTILQGFNRAAWFVVPITGMWTAYTAVTYAATSLRGKDDLINSALGGMAAGYIYGTWQKCGATTFTAMMVLALAGVVKKHAVQNGYVFIPERRQVYGYHNTMWADWTYTPEGAKGWTTGKE